MTETGIAELRSRNLVWHYTTLEVLQLILEGGTLLATEVSYQNDPREPDTAHDAIQEALVKLGDEPAYETFSREASRWLRDWRDSNGFIAGNSGRLEENSRFILCASTDPDNLYAWRTYSANSRTGCAIGMDPGTPLGVVGKDANKSYVGLAPWREVIYDHGLLMEFSTARLRTVGDSWNEEKLRDEEWGRAERGRGVPENLVNEDIYAFRVLLTDLSDAASEITAVAKHGSFRDERETRVTVSGAAFGVVFSPGASGPRPRVRLASSNQWGEILDSAVDRLPIRAIVLAPNAGREATTTTEWLLYAHGYPLDAVRVIDESGDEPMLAFDDSEKVEIFQSAHPYRDV